MGRRFAAIMAADVVSYPKRKYSNCVRTTMQIIRRSIKLFLQSQLIPISPFFLDKILDISCESKACDCDVLTVRISASQGFFQLPSHRPTRQRSITFAQMIFHSILKVGVRLMGLPDFFCDTLAADYV